MNLSNDNSPPVRRILICGGRDYDSFDDKRMMITIFNMLQTEFGRFELICGMAPGADMMAHGLATKRKLKIHEFHAQWKALGRKAGPIRNKRMLDEGKPDRVYAFPGGRGTENMVDQAQAAGVNVYRVKRPEKER